MVVDRPPADDDLVADACRELLTDVEDEWTWSEDPPFAWRPRVAAIAAFDCCGSQRPAR